MVAKTLTGLLWPRARSAETSIAIRAARVLHYGSIAGAGFLVMMGSGDSLGLYANEARPQPVYVSVPATRPAVPASKPQPARIPSLDELLAPAAPPPDPLDAETAKDLATPHLKQVGATVGPIHWAAVMSPLLTALLYALGLLLAGRVARYVLAGE